MDKRLEEIRARVEAATEGPWNLYGERTNDDGLGIESEYTTLDIVSPGQYMHAPGDPCGVLSEENAEFIAHSREDIPYLLDRLTQAQGRIAELSAALSRYGRHAYDCHQHLNRGVGWYPCSCGYAAAMGEQQPTTLTKEGGE